MYLVEATTAPDLYVKMMRLMRTEGIQQNSRNGGVLSLPEPLLVKVTNPSSRVLFDPIRCANPFFHVMEFVWMMAGSQNPDWICQFNARFIEYADTNNHGGRPLIHGAYGFRWRVHFATDQIMQAVKLLRNNPEDRRVVLGMWNPNQDLGKDHADVPCNTHIYFRVVNGKLDMTVCNRSNDVVWGMVGANIVHMTLLHELIANATDIPIGNYYVMTNNAHVYVDLDRVEEMLQTVHTDTYELASLPILLDSSAIEDFLEDCRNFITHDAPPKTTWIADVARPMYELYTKRKHKPREEYIHHLEQIRDPQWQKAAELWLQWKSK